METIARHVWISGRVQGVAFRHHAKVRARELALAGWVQNLPDGRVEAWVEGRPEGVAEMLSWLERGPPMAHVEEVEVRSAPPTGAEGFQVRRG